MGEGEGFSSSSGRIIGPPGKGEGRGEGSVRSPAGDSSISGVWVVSGAFGSLVRRVSSSETAVA